MPCRRVFFYTDSYSFGGAERAMFTAIRNLDTRQWFPTLLTHSRNEVNQLEAIAQDLGIRHQSLPCVDQLRTHERVLSCMSFIQSLGDDKPHVFHAHLNWPLACRVGLVAASLSFVPAVVATVHSFNVIGLRRLIYLQSLISLGVHRYIAVSDAVANKLRNVLNVPPGKLTTIRNGIAPESFRCSSNKPLRASLANGTQRSIVLTTARLDYLKGHRYLFDAIESLPNVQLVLVGEGPERFALEAYVSRLGIQDRVTFLGQRDDVPCLLACCDMFVLPSLNEGLPLAVLEAMAAAKPVIATDVGGTGEAIINDVCGILVPPANAGAIRSAILRILSNEQHAAQMALAGRDRVDKNFRATRMAERLMQVYQDILGNN